MSTRHDLGVARQIGTCSNSAEVAPVQRWQFGAGTLGLMRPGFPPEAGFCAAAPVR